MAGLSIWGFICTLYGTEEQIAVNLKIAQEAFKADWRPDADRRDAGDC
jgi:hypothetical protein